MLHRANVSAAPAVECAACGHIIDESTELDPHLRAPCPGCGATSRLIKVAIEDSVSVHDMISLVLKGDRPGVRGRLLRVKSGASLSADGTWAEVIQVVDRVRRRYRKRVVTADGRVVRNVDEPLEDHNG